MKKAYISGITNDAFLPGVLVMFLSLKEHMKNPDIQQLCLVTEDVSVTSRNRLKSIGVIPVPVESIRDASLARWSTTFTKIKIFDLVDYDKLIWIDADMMVIECLDSLFERPHLSCVRSRSPYPGEERYPFNSGLMVIVPNHTEYGGICELLPSIVEEYSTKGMAVGDQNVLNAFYSEWYDDPKKRLEDGYNVFWGSVEEYIDRGYSLGDDSAALPVYVLHYTGGHKPWQKSAWFWMKSYIRSLRHQRRMPSKQSVWAMRKYRSYMKMVK